MAGFVTRKRLWIWGAALVVVGGLWVYRWRVATLVLRAMRPSHKPVAADQLLARLSTPGGIWAALLSVGDVPEKELPQLLSSARALPEETSLQLDWMLLERGFEPAHRELVARAANGRPLDLARLLPWADIWAECAFRRPVTEADERVKNAAARLALAAMPRSAPAADLDRLLALAVLGIAPAPDAAAALARLDDLAAPPTVRLKLHLIAGLAESLKLEERLLTHTDERARGWSAQGLLCGLASREARRLAADRLEAALAAGRAAEPELARRTALELRWEPAS